MSTPVKIIVLGREVLSCTRNVSQISTDVPYPSPIPLVFLSGLVSPDSVDFGSVYFARSENKQSQIYVTQYDGIK
jgi:hypothetical protein